MSKRENFAKSGHTAQSTTFYYYLVTIVWSGYGYHTMLVVFYFQNAFNSLYFVPF